jgi:succinate dehydrogenase / fumarate reductase membrane anchor subunit
MLSGSITWKWQRLSAFYLLLVILYVSFVVAIHSPLTFSFWHGFVSQLHMRVILSLAYFFVTIHAYLGLRCVVMDYIKCPCLQKKFMLIISLALLSSCTYAFIILGR